MIDLSPTAWMILIGVVLYLIVGMITLVIMTYKDKYGGFIWAHPILVLTVLIGYPVILIGYLIDELRN